MYTIDDFECYFNNAVPFRGNGIATFYKNQFSLKRFFTNSKFQIVQLTSELFDVFNIYYKNENEKDFLLTLQNILSDSKLSIICGDFNVDYLHNKTNSVIEWLEKKSFVQMVDFSTQIQGGLIDHCWVPKELVSKAKIYRSSVVFSDHDLLHLSITLEENMDL